MANVGQAMYAPIPQPNSASASIEMSRPTLNALSTDVVFFWLPVYGILQRFAPAGEADVHFLVLVSAAHGSGWSLTYLLSKCTQILQSL
jgi:hypothetical protein